MNWSKPLPRAVLAALLTLLVAAPILGLRLQTPGLNLEVHLADAPVWWLIGSRRAGCRAAQGRTRPAVVC